MYWALVLAWFGMVLVARYSTLRRWRKGYLSTAQAASIWGVVWTSLAAVLLGLAEVPPIILVVVLITVFISTTAGSAMVLSLLPHKPSHESPKPR